MGTVAVTNVRPLGQMSQVRGKALIATITMSASYATGGDTLDLADLHFDRVLFFAPLSKFDTTVKVRGVDLADNVAGGAYVAAGTATVPLIQSFVGDATPTESSNATDLSGSSFDALIVGQ